MMTNRTAQIAEPAARVGNRVGRASARPARRRPSTRKRLELILLLTPALLMFLGFVLAPVVAAVYYSFFRWTGFSPRVTNGFGNYSRALHDTVFLHGILHNLIIAALSIAIQLPLSLGVALLLDRRMFGRRFLRLVVFAPYVLSEATTAVVWLLMLQPGGLVDHGFEAVGGGGLIHQWLADTHIVLYTLFVVLTWKFIGFGIILLLAGMQNIPHELREAAAIDGAGYWHTTRRIVLPLLGPTIRIWIFLSVIGSLLVFALVWIMTLGGPADASNTMATYLLEHGFTSYQFGYGSAVAVILFIVCFAFALVYQRFALRRDIEGAVTRMAG
jgi:raffinose/stachyose/melibiose transport system permease protein